jgi:hypothetical protein
MRLVRGCGALCVVALALWSCARRFQDRAAPLFGEFQVVVELENEVYESYDSTANEAGPMWAFGNSTIARIGDRVFASGDEPVAGASGYNRIRWGLYELAENRWTLAYRDAGHLTREPSPIAVLGGDRLVLSANPTVAPEIPKWGPSRPTLYNFDERALGVPATREPSWPDAPGFNHHSYRSLAADRESGDSILFHHDDHGKLRWAWFRGAEQAGQGVLPWLVDEGYESPQVVRVCYPAVQIKGSQVHFLGVSDIPEPNKAWKDYKYSITGRVWDYDFRRLFYVYSTDIESGVFSDWIEIASRDSTAGNIMPCDLYIDDAMRVHALWYERALDDRLRSAFFPEARQSIALEYAIVEDGKVASRASVMKITEDEWHQEPLRGRFHKTPDGRLFVLYSVATWEHTAEAKTEDRMVQVSDERGFSEPRPVPLQTPMRSFYTATQRAGNAPSDVVDLLGEEAGSIRYARLRIR